MRGGDGGGGGWFRQSGKEEERRACVHNEQDELEREQRDERHTEM